MEFKWFDSLRFRLIVLICLSAIPPLAVVLYNAAYERDRIELDASENAYKLALLASKYQGGLVEGTKELLVAISHSPLVVSGDWNKCSQYLQTVLTKNLRYSNLGIASLNGDIICSGKPLNTKLNISDRTYIINALKTGAFSVGDYHVGRVTGVPSIGMALPIVGADDQTIALAYAAIDLETLKATVNEIKLPQDGILFMFDRNEKLLVQSQQQPEPWVIEHARTSWKKAGGASPDNSEIYRHQGGSPWIFATSHLRDISDARAISIVIATPLESMLSESRRYYLLSLAAMFFGTLVVLAISLFGIQAFVLRRIETLIQATNLIGQGNFDLKVKEQIKGGELGQLAQHIDSMANKIERSLTREQEYRYLFERNPNPMWIFSRESLRYLAVNEAAIRHYGFSRDEFLKMTIADVVQDYEFEHVREFLDNVKENELQTSQWRHAKKRGEEIVVEVATYPIEFHDMPAILVSIKDITDEAKMRASLADRDEQIRSMLESTAEAICGIDLAGNCTFGNPALARLLGYDDLEMLIGKNLHAMAHHTNAYGEPLAFESCDIYKAIHQGDRCHSDKEVFWHKDGTMFPVEYWAYPMRRDEKVIGAVVTFIDITERKLQQQALEFQAGHDALTGLPNRRLLTEHMQTLCANPKQCFYLIMIDLDRFKEVNDALGHQAGDLLLMQISARLKQSLNRRGDFLARLGGDEFAVVIQNLPPDTTALDIAKRLLTQIEQPVEITNIKVQIGASVGIAAFPDHGEESGDLMRCADVAMYSAKKSGTLAALYDRALDNITAEHLALMSDLHQAIEQNQLILHFQPKISLHNQHVDSFEALIRWNHPEKGMIPPNQFIPLIELTSLIRPFTAWVLENALIACRKWRTNGLHVGVAVNVSTRNLLDLALPDQIEMLLAKYEIPADCLELEITESAIMSDPVRSLDVLTRLHQRGIHISIDDFGTGYSSLEYLQKLPINGIKIDQTFIRQMVMQEEAISIVKAVISLAHSLKIEVVAEGVEDEPTMEILADLGCDIIQGFFISRPMDIEHLFAWLEQRSQAAVTKMSRGQGARKKQS